MRLKIISKSGRLISFLALLLFSIFWIALLSGTDTLNSGFHLTDDHEMISISNELNGKNTFETIMSRVDKDLAIRFRPMYFTQRVISIELLGIDFFYLSSYLLVLAILTTWFLFNFARKIEYNVLESILFAFLSLIGAHTVIWWKLGPPGSFAVFCLAVSIFFMASSVKDSRYKDLKKVVFIFFTVIASLTVEPFVLLIPAITFWYLWICSKENKIKNSGLKAESFLLDRKTRKPNSASTPALKGWGFRGNPIDLYKTIKKNVLLIIFFAIVTLTELFVILKVVGTNKIGYAGVDAGTFSIRRILSTFKVITFEGFFYLILIAGLFLFAHILYKALKNRSDSLKTFIRSSLFLELLFAVLLFILIVFPQVILHAKSGINERYLIPGILGYSFLLTFLLKQIRLINSVNKILGLLNQVLYFVLIFFSFLTIGFKLRGVISDANTFADDGRAINQAFGQINKNLDINGTIVIVADPAFHYEWIYSIEIYQAIKENRDSFYFIPVMSQKESEYNDFHRSLMSDIYKKWEGRVISQLPEGDGVAVLAIEKPTIDTLLAQNKEVAETLRNFDMNGFGDYITYTK